MGSRTPPLVRDRTLKAVRRAAPERRREIAKTDLDAVVSRSPPGTVKESPTTTQRAADA
jgi:hypothetical protein